MAKTPLHKKNARRRAAGLPPLQRQAPLTPYDGEKVVFDMLVAIKKDPPPFLPPARQLELSRWAPPAVRCTTCGWTGDLTGCGRTYFPPGNIGWDCGGCRRRLVEGTDYVKNIPVP